MHTVIGIGGSGIRVAAELASEPGSAAVVPVVLAIDTDTRAERLGIRTFNLGALDLARASALVGDTIRRSVDLRVLNQLSRTRVNFGAAALPELGLVCCVSSAPQLSSWLGRELRGIQRRIGSDTLQIGVVGSIAGGTGTGVLIAIAPLVREALKNSALDGNIHGCALTASFFTNLGGHAAHLLRNERFGIEHLKRGLPKSGLPYSWDSFVLAKNEDCSFRWESGSAVGRALRARWLGTDAENTRDVVFTDLAQVDKPESSPEEPPFQSERVPKVFISYAREDEQHAAHLYDLFRTRGYKPWMDICDLRAGQEWEPAIKQAIRDADFILICLSTRALSKRGFIQNEIRFALECYESIPFGQAFVIPVRLENCAPPQPLCRFQYVDLFTDEGFDMLDRSIMEHWIDKNAGRHAR
jgi:TIR domain/Tubulin like